jgi:outer membrane protein
MRKQLFYIALLFPLLCGAQESVYTYKQVIATALKNNFDIQLAQNNAAVAGIQNTLGNAGMLPRLDLNASGGKSSNDIRQNFSSGLTVDQNGVKSDNITSGAYLTWTVFDGLKMFATKERLHLLEQQGQLSLRLQIENTLEEVTLYYYQVVKQQQLIKGILAAMSVSDERIRIAERKLTLGSGSNVEVLQAKLDLNAQRSDLVTQRYLLNEFKNGLLVLIKEEPGASYKVDSSFAFEPIASIESIRQRIEQSNTTLQIVQKNTLIYNQNIKELQSQYMPRLALTSNYLFSRSSNAAGFSLFTQNLGFNYGFTFSWNLFNGLNTRNQVRVARVQAQSSIFEAERARYNIFSTAHSAYVRWLGDKEILEIEEGNITLAEQSLKITTERLRLGLGNFLETKESQNSYEGAITRLVNARYNLKQSETALRKLTGELIKEN